MFCGDEVAAVVADIGSSMSKFGTAGEDSPKHVFRSDIGKSLSDPSKISLDMGLRAAPEHIEIQRLFVHDSLCWENVEALIQYGIQHMRIDVKDNYAMLFAESHFKSLYDKIKVSNHLYSTIF